eukprot:TRINITY_DN4416_c0_g1_i1.p2 TRINITY_DN4416_c0_g1~~TRINITY_DN4416_c0_g1_i1.p2  ORF type:complete len:123 (-),score=24.85 TRINITY_DN4416_c0_g1_i1:60-407(-)
MAKPKKEAILNLEKYMDQPVVVKFVGGREVTGVLKGYDTNVNLVLDETKEFVRDLDDPYKRRLIEDPHEPDTFIEETRELGLVVCRGPIVQSIMPLDGTEEIEDPFGAQVALGAE